MDVLDAIKTRRSIRHYKPDPVDDATIRKVLEAAQWAPSWSNTQCWRFIVVRDSDIKARLAQTLTKVARSDDTLVDNPAIKAIIAAPVVIVICAQMGIAGKFAGKIATDKGDWFMFDIALAMQNLTLAAHALGLGTVIVGAIDARKVAETLWVPAGYSVVVMTPLGFPEREGKVTPRKELSDIVFYDKFGH